MTSPPPTAPGRPGAASWVAVVLAWIAVGIPLAWGIYRTLRSAVALFR